GGLCTPHGGGEVGAIAGSQSSPKVQRQHLAPPCGGEVAERRNDAKAGEGVFSLSLRDDSGRKAKGRRPARGPGVTSSAGCRWFRRSSRSPSPSRRRGRK